jgi:alkanesulfonate monooxygenase SsuD/methylene tetrahydromethanopterin reductase-like flavin-dependent oxidoreductase (luciferase family)
VTLGVAFGWQQIAFEPLLDLVRRAEAAGYDAAYIDGDVSVMERRGEGDVLDGWTATVALLARTERIAIGSIRLPHHWNAARLAQAAATADRIFPGRLRLLASIGAHDADRRFGLPFRAAAERIVQLDETLDAVRALWRGEDVTRAGRYVTLDRARVRPVPPRGRIPIEIGARREPLLSLVARHGDRWDVNLPPIARIVEPAARALAAACAREGRNPDSIGRTMWLWVRPGVDPADRPASHADFLHWNPWHRGLPEGDLRDAVIGGSPETCRDRIRSVCDAFAIDLPVLDLSGLAYDAARQILDTLAPGKPSLTPR